MLTNSNLPNSSVTLHSLTFTSVLLCLVTLSQKSSNFCLPKVSVVDSYLSGNSYVGGIVGYCDATAAYTGASYYGGIMSCYNAGYVSGNGYQGGYHEIGNAGQLFWFAEQVNLNGNREICGILTADIDLENRVLTPIGATGESNYNFRGLFDGQGHTITGLNVTKAKNGMGFFGEVRTDTVKNFTIYGEVAVSSKVATLIANISLACVLMIVGILFYKETMSLKQTIGIIISAIGLVLIAN